MLIFIKTPNIMHTLKLIYPIFFLLITNGLYAQQYLDQSCTWGILRTSWKTTGYHEQYITITIAGDTTIQGNTYHKLYQEGVDSITAIGSTTPYAVSIAKSLYGLWREDSSKIYTYNSIGQDVLLYDFTRPLGDVVSQGTGCTDTIITIDSVYLGSAPLKRWNFNPNSGMLSYIEGVGAVTEPLGPRCAITGNGATLICYSRNGNQLQINPNLTCVVHLSTTAIQPKTLEAEIYPNPTLRNVTIALKELKRENAFYQLYNINGQLLEAATINASQVEVDLSAYPKGVYSLKVQSENQTLIQKLIKI